MFKGQTSASLEPKGHTSVRDDILNLFDTVRKCVRSETWELPVCEQLLEARTAFLTMIHTGVTADLIDSGIEEELWNLHTEVNRNHRDRLMKCDRKRESVSWRRKATTYKSFLKDAQHDYRNLFRAIDKFYGPIEEMHAMGSLMNDSDVSEVSCRRGEDTNVGHQDQQIYKQVRRLGSTILVRLGDLSRWRHDASLDTRQNQKSSYNPAREYYELALNLRPESSLAYNQLGILASSAGDIFDAVYDFLRATCVERRAPNAVHNLRLQLRKASSMDEADLINACGQKESSRDSTILRLKSSLLRHLSGRCAVETRSNHSWDVCVQLLRRFIRSDLTEDRQILLRAIFLMIVGCDWLESSEQNDVNCTPNESRPISPHFTASFFQALVERMNIVLQRQSNGLKQGQDEDLHAILPLLHVGMIWLNSHCLPNANDGVEISRPDKLSHDLWSDLAACLDAIVGGFEVRSYSDLPYLLPEEEDLIGFLPIQDANLVGKSSKPRKATYTWQNARIGRADNSSCTEDDKVKARLRAIVTLGLRLVKMVSLPLSTPSLDQGLVLNPIQDTVPLIFAGGRFLYMSAVE